MEVWVKPLVVFVGDWRVRNDWQNTDARVFTTDRLVSHILNQQPRLKRSEIPPSLKLRRGRQADRDASGALAEKLTIDDCRTPKAFASAQGRERGRSLLCDIYFCANLPVQFLARVAKISKQ
jgi:hypothetical protein